MTSPNRRDIVLDIEVRSDTRGVGALNKGLDDTSKSADKAGTSLDRMGDDAARVRSEIEKTTAKIKDLDKQLLDVGDDRVLRSQMRAAESRLSMLRRIEGRMPSPGIISPPAAPISRGVMMPSAVGAAVVGLLVPALPTIGAMLAGAAAGTIGTGGIAGGVLMAFRDERLKAAAKDFGDDIANEFFSGGDAFVGPAIRGLEQIKGAFREMEVPEAFEKMAPLVNTISGGIADFGRNIMPGLNLAFDRMGPFAEVAAKGIGDMGTAFGDFFDSVTASEGSIQGLSTFFAVLNGTIIGLGNTLEFLSDVYGGVVMVEEKMLLGAQRLAGVGGMPKVVGAIDFVRTAFKRATGTSDGLSAGFRGVGDATGAIIEGLNGTEDATGDARKEMEKLNDAISDYMGLTMSQAELADRWQVGLAELRDRLAETGGNINLNTEAGQRNRDMIRDQIQIAQRERDLMIERTGKVAEANAKYEAQIAVLEGIAGQSGITRAELEAMAGDYRITIRIRTVGAEVTRIMQAAVAEAFASAAAQRSRALPEFATGGIVGGPPGAPQLAIVHGGEQVLTPQQQMMRSGGGGQHFTMSLQATGDSLVDAFLPILAKAIQVRGGDGRLIGIRTVG